MVCRTLDAATSIPGDYSLCEQVIYLYALQICAGYANSLHTLFHQKLFKVQHRVFEYRLEVKYIMATAKARYLQKVFEEKYGVIGKVAGKYLEAGYSIEFMHPTRYGKVHILARKEGKILAIEVIDKSGNVDENVVKTFLEKAKLLKAKPILVLYSDGPKITENLYKFCIDNGIKIRRIKSD
jgi:hypothetical protein